MMIGMMTPVAMPVLLLLAKKRRVDSQSDAVVWFGLGHISIWIAFSFAAASLQWSLHRLMLLSMSMAITSPYVAGLILIGVGIYQLTPAKAKCLTKCQSPLDFVMTNWREGSFMLGIRHGLYCLGCCWALMGVLFVVGVMNLVWVALLTAFIFIEKFGPRGLRVARAAGVVIILAGIVSMFYGQA
jgi:predicted metal-binding membrane protein